MNDQIHCITYQMKGMYGMHWMLGEKILFSEHLGDAFRLSTDEQKKLVVELMANHPEELIDPHVDLSHQHSQPHVFCRRELVDALLDEALEILNKRGLECDDFSGSFEGRLQSFRSTNKELFEIINKKVDEYRRGVLTEQLEQLAESIGANAEVAQSIKRRRRDIAPVIDALERMAPLRAPEPVPVTKRFVDFEVAEPVVFKPTFTAPLKKKTAPKLLAKPATLIAADDDLCCEL